MIITALIFILPLTLFKKGKKEREKQAVIIFFFFFHQGGRPKRSGVSSITFRLPPPHLSLQKLHFHISFSFLTEKKNICCFRGVWESGGIWRSKPFSDNSKFLTFHTILHCSDLVRFEKNFVFINWMQFFLLSRQLNKILCTNISDQMLLILLKCMVVQNLICEESQGYVCSCVVLHCH